MAAPPLVSTRFRKRFGQHILSSNKYLDHIVRAADIQPGDTVLEIGAGTGNLTERILRQAQKLIAVEIDVRMCEELKVRFGKQCVPPPPPPRPPALTARAASSCR